MISAARRSFRLKIAVLAALICGGVIGAFGLVLWSHLEHDRTTRLDLALTNMAHDQLDFVLAATDRAPCPFPRCFYGEEFRDVALAAYDAEGRQLHRSQNWPESIGFADLPQLDTPGRCPQAHSPAGSHGDPDVIGHRHHGSRCPRASGFLTLERDGRTWRLGGVGDGALTLAVALDLARFQDAMRRTRSLFMVAVPLALLGAALGGWWIASRALRPVRDVTEAAESVTAPGLSRRIPETAQDREFARLIQVLNGMLSRLERSFEQAARFSADASHELRTPLAIMQGEVETALRAVPPGGDASRALTTQLEEIHGLKSLVDRLLLLSRADRGALLSRSDHVDLTAIVRRAAEDAATLRDDVTCESEVAKGVSVTGDEALLERAVLNLVANAAKYNRPAGSIRLELVAGDRDAVLRVANTGPPIAWDDRDRIFDRFFRSDPARTRRVHGTGLGLSLAREIARAHGGDLVLEASGEAETIFALRVPLGP